ncbi:MAG: SCO family protein [Thermosynechococcaceae cyanobacterium]
MPQFTLTDQNGQSLKQQDLRGQVWVASFIYTSCPDVCPLITRQVAALRDALAASQLLGDSVRLVSFTVDPERDSPAVLQTYAQKFKAENPKRWAFLTGDSDQMRALLVDGFHLIVEPNAQAVMGDHAPAQMAATGDIAHSNRAMIVDRCGQVRAIHPVLDPDRFKQLVRDLTAVVQETGTCDRIL